MKVDFFPTSALNLHEYIPTYVHIFQARSILYLGERNTLLKWFESNFFSRWFEMNVKGIKKGKILLNKAKCLFYCPSYVWSYGISIVSVPFVWSLHSFHLTLQSLWGIQTKWNLHFTYPPSLFPWYFNWNEIKCFLRTK